MEECSLYLLVKILKWIFVRNILWKEKFLFTSWTFKSSNAGCRCISSNKCIYMQLNSMNTYHFMSFKIAGIFFLIFRLWLSTLLVICIVCINLLSTLVMYPIISCVPLVTRIVIAQLKRLKTRSTIWTFRRKFLCHVFKIWIKIYWCDFLKQLLIIFHMC